MDLGAADLPGAERIPIWLDCDTGHDDAFAILLAAYHPRAQLLGISTVHGNAPLAHTTHNTRAVLVALGQRDGVRVVRGAAAPLQRAATHAAAVHGASGLDGVTLLPDPGAYEGPADARGALAAAAAALLAQPARTAWLVATGSLTNVALLLRWHPAVAGHVAGVSIMGGAVGDGYTGAPLGSVLEAATGRRVARAGNWTPWAEFNVFTDPEAARAVLCDERLAGRVVLAPLDLTHLVRATAPVREQLFGGNGAEGRGLSRTRRMMREVLLFFTEAYAKGFDITDGPPLHDPVAVFAVVAPECFDDGGGERWDVDVVMGGDRDGQTVLRLDRDGSGARIRVPRGIDLEAFWGSIEVALREAERKVEGTDWEESRKDKT